MKDEPTQIIHYSFEKMTVVSMCLFIADNFSQHFFRPQRHMISHFKRDGDRAPVQPGGRRRPQRSSFAKHTPGTSLDQPLEDERHELLSYVAQLSGELATMARSARFDALAYFLEMARIEALGGLSRLEPQD